jgi:hypothetical protein
MPIAAVTAGALIDPTAFGNAVVDAINPGAWTAPPLVNSWVSFGAPYNAPQYRKIGTALAGNELVYLRGLVKSGALSAVIFNLPAGFRPPAAVQFQARGTATYIDIGTNGDVSVFGGNNAAVVLDGIIFAVQ